MCIYGMWPWEVPKWPWFWLEVAVKAWLDLATLECTTVHYQYSRIPMVYVYIVQLHCTTVKERKCSLI
jgi:hypothetical protein